MRRLSIIAILAICSLFASACATGKYVYVDESNKTGPWDGSEAYPYKKIQDGLNKAHTAKYKGVKVSGGVYNENVVLEDGLSLQRAKGSTNVLVQGNSSSPTITAKGRNYIADLMVDNGSVGISVEIGKILNTYDNPMTIITDNIIESTDAIIVKTDSSLAFSPSARKKPIVSISGNWIRKGQFAGGTGINVALTGPKTGQLSLRMAINDNLIWDKQTCIALSAKGQGANPGGFVRTQITGEIANNLLFGCNLSGIRMESENLGDASTMVFGNSLVYGGGNAIVASAISGPDGDSTTHPNVTNNIIAYNSGCGYVELEKKTSASELQNNVFYQNKSGHYADIDTGLSMNTQKDLNTSIVNNKVVFYNGSGNLVANPQFETGVLHWNGVARQNEKAGDFFLTKQGSNKSPCIDAGFGTALDGGVSKKTTRTDYINDTGNADIGFHYTKE
jgi:hypothetical protein